MGEAGWKSVLTRLCPAPLRRLLYKWFTGDPFSPEQREALNSMRRQDAECLDAVQGCIESLSERLSGCDSRSLSAHAEIALLETLLLSKGLIAQDELERRRTEEEVGRLVDEATDPAYEKLRKIQEQLEELRRKQQRLTEEGG